MNNETLKHCPFCGGKVERTAWFDKTDRFDCEKCHAVIFWDEKSGDESDTAWNKRWGEVYEVTVDCKNAEKDLDGKCRGYYVSEYKDELSEPCKYCKDNEFYKRGGRK